MDKDAFLKNLMEMNNIQDKIVAEKGLKIVFSILSHRLLQDEADDVEAQLPQNLKKLWHNDVWITNYLKLSGKKLKYKHVTELLSLVENELKRENLPLNAENITTSVFHLLKEQISEGEVEDIYANLSGELKEFFKAA